jgi:phage terminase large subunit-like protein
MSGNQRSGRRAVVRYDDPAVVPAVPVLLAGESMADQKVRLINSLTHTKGPFAGQPFHLRAWQETIVRALFATDAFGRRLRRMLLLMLPRKNGKSELCAAFAIDGLLWDGERGAEVYSAAADRDQASLVFNVAAQMIRQDATLSSQCDISDSRKRITHRPTRNTYQAISAESYNKHGYNASRIIYDELHAAPSRDLWDVLISSVGARDQPLMIAISTAGYDKHSILYELYQHAQKVIENPALDPAFLPVLFEAAAGDDWTSEAVWQACNPALGDFRSLEEMRAACARAQAIPAQENWFRRLYLNQWTEQAVRWLSLAAWDACVQLPAPLGDRACYVGLDLSSRVDLTALVGVFPDGDTFDVRAEFFVPADGVTERVKRDRVPYDQWIRDGWITPTPGAVIDYAIIRQRVHAWRESYELRELGFDPWNAQQLMTELDADGLTCVPIRQGFPSLTSPSKSLEAAILSGRLRHDGNPVLRWMVQNVSLETDPAGNIKPSKRQSTDRIDGVIALIMALDRLDRQAGSRPPEYQMVMLEL